MRDNADCEFELFIRRHKGLCEQCGERPGEWCFDPYYEEVYRSERWVFICTDCYNESLQDI